LEAAGDVTYSGKDRRTNIAYRRLYIAADVNASWEKVELLCLFSTDTAFTQRKHDKYYLQIKIQKLAGKNSFERLVKLQADSGRIRGTRDKYCDFYWLKEWS